MTDRGRSHKAKSPDSKPANSAEITKQTAVPRCSGKDCTGARQNGPTKEQKPKQQKKTNDTEEKPSAQSVQKEKPTKPGTEEIKKQQRTPPENTQTPAHGKTNTKAANQTKTEPCAEAGRRKQPETPKDTGDEPVQITKPKEEKSQEELQVEIKLQHKALKDTSRDALNTPRTKTDACVPQGDAAVTSLLYTTLENLKIRTKDRSDASKVVNELIRSITKHLKNNTQCFKEVGEPLHTGSYYEKLKISNPDEFDVMIPIPVERVTIKPFREDGAFYSVGLKRGNSPLQEFQENDTLSGSKMLTEFRKEVKKCVKAFPDWEVTKKKTGCPAVTLIVTVKSVEISLDLVLSLVVKSSWPPDTKEGLKIEGWLGRKVKQEYKYKPYYLVPKYEGKGTVENDGVLAKDVWRISFSHVEKAILMNHGSEKTCCEADGTRCCRKDCLKLLKHLLSLLKEKDSSLDKFCSYHAKTTLFHACCSRTKDHEWKASDLSRCFHLLLEDFVGHLEKGQLSNFFIPTQNLLSGPSKKSCSHLVCCIREQRDKGFPIFK